MATNLTLLPGTLTSVCYPASAQTLYNEIMSKAVAVLPAGLGGVIISSSEPGVSDQDKLWIKISASGQPSTGIFIYGSGAWVWPHEVPASSSFRWMWTGTTSALQTIDGGSAVAVTDTTGPFWEVDTDFAQRIPIGPGTLPLSGTVIAAGTTGGVDQVTLTEATIPAHSHFGPTIHHTAALDWTYVNTYGTTAVAGTNKAIDPTSDTFSGRVRPATQPTGDGDPHDNMPPYRGIYLVKRTARIYRTP